MSAKILAFSILHHDSEDGVIIHKSSRKDISGNPQENSLDQRLQQLTVWAESLFPGRGIQVEPASGDASFRRYFRVINGQQRFILMDAPPDKEDSGPFVRIAGWLQAMGLSAPQILHANDAAGFYLLTDLGNEQYLARLSDSSADDLYRDAIDALVEIQIKGKAYETDLPNYDQKLLHREMQLFTDWYLGRHLQHQLNSQQAEILTETFFFLAQNALAQPRVFVHRDYHSRNLMYIDNKAMQSTLSNPGILDFQDAVCGPVTYDLVSLLRDCYIAWPDAQVKKWLHYHYQSLSEWDELRETTEQQYQTWFDLMGIQRHLKATGIFARLNYRDSKPGYLADIPRTMNYVLSVAQQYSQLTPFLNLLDELSVSKQLLVQHNSEQVS